MARKSFAAITMSLVLTAVAFAQGAATTAATSASPAASGKTAVINIQAAIVNTNEGRRDFDALQKKFEPKQAELKTLNDEVDSLKKQLAAQQDKLNDEERANRARSIDQKQKNLQRQLEDAQNDFNAQQSDLANRIGTKMMDVVDKYARENGFSVVLDVSGQASNVIWASEQVNITPQIVEAYNTASGVPAPAGAPTKPTSAPTVKRPSSQPTTPKKPQ